MDERLWKKLSNLFGLVLCLSIVLFSLSVVSLSSSSSTLSPTPTTTTKPSTSFTLNKKWKTSTNRSNRTISTTVGDDITAATTTTTATIVTEPTTKNAVELSTQKNSEKFTTVSPSKSSNSELEKEEIDDDIDVEDEEKTDLKEEHDRKPHENESENDDDDEEEYYEEEPRCTFSKFMSGLNISEFMPQDRDSLKSEFDSFNDIPDRIRDSPSVNHTIQRLKRLLTLASEITSHQEFRSGVTTLIQRNYDMFFELELDASCLASLVSIFAALRRQELWAIKFLDSFAKPPAGLLSGVTSFFGDFDQCLSIQSPNTVSEEFTGQYCFLRPVLQVPDLRKYSWEEDESLLSRPKILNYLSAYNIDQYVETNLVLKLIEQIKSLQNQIFNYAICVPNLCSPQQLTKSFNKLLYPIIGIPFEIKNSSCWTKAKTQEYNTVYFSKQAQFAILVLVLIGSLVIVSTIFELYFYVGCHNHDGDFLRNHYKPNCLSSSSSSSSSSSTSFNSFSKKRKRFMKMVSVFSAYNNTRSLLATSASRIELFDTLRLLIVILIGLCNAFYNTPFSLAIHNIYHSAPYELLSDPKYFFIRAPSLLNDGLLIIAGALFVQSIFRHLNQPHDAFSHLMYLTRRWFRLTLPLFGSIMFLYLLPLTGFGPLWDRLVEILLPACTSPSSFTSTLLYYSNWNFVKNNYTNDNSYLVCNPDSWFLSIIYQLNIAFFMIVLLMYQLPRNGLRILVLFIIASVVLNLSPKIFHKNTRTYYELTKQPSMWNLRRNFFLYHQNILQYVGSFCVGLLLGYAIIAQKVNINENNDNDDHHSYKKQNSNDTIFKRKKTKKLLAYNCLALIGIIWPFFWVNRFFVQNTSPSEWSVLMFFSFGRLIFSLSLAWIIYVCVTKKSPLLEWCLSFRSIQPVARLSFSIFLIQPLVIYHRIYSVKDTYVMTFRSTIENYTIDFLISTLVGYVLYLLFEAPAIRLNEIFIGTTTTTTQPNSNNFANNNLNGNSDQSYHNEVLSEKKKITTENNNSKRIPKTITELVDNKLDPNFPTKEDFFEQNDVISIRF